MRGVCHQSGVRVEDLGPLRHRSLSPRCGRARRAGPRGSLGQEPLGSRPFGPDDEYGTFGVVDKLRRDGTE